MSSSDELTRRRYFEDWSEMRDQLLADAGTAQVWRGVSNASWCILASLDRFATEHGLLDRAQLQHKLLDLYASRSAELGLDAEVLSDTQKWALGQHWGLPTPYLDWSSSPMVGAYFAASSADSLPDAERTLAIYSLDVVEFEKPGDTQVIAPPQGPWNSRMRAQQGLFTELSVGGCLIDTLRSRDQLGSLAVYMCPARARNEILLDLEKMTVDALTMFPDREGVIRHVRTLASRPT